MGADHPVAWCKDYQGGRSFYTGVGATGELPDADVRKHLAGAISGPPGEADPVYSDCGATVLANYQQTKISVTPNLNEPIGFDLLPDGRVLQTARARRAAPARPRGRQLEDHRHARRSTPTARTASTARRSTTTSPPTTGSTSTTRRRRSSTSSSPTARTKTITTPPNAAAPTRAPSLERVGPLRRLLPALALQVRRRRRAPGAPGPRAEQKILRVANNRGACCHVAGDIDFDKHNNLWLVTGDDTPVRRRQLGRLLAAQRHEDRRDADRARQQRHRRHVHAHVRRPDDRADRRSTRPRPQIQAALEALSNVDAGDVIVTGGPVNTRERHRVSSTAPRADERAQLTADTSGLTGTTPTVAIATTQEGDWFQAPFVDARRSAGNTNDLRGKVLRIHVNADGSYTTPGRATCSREPQAHRRRHDASGDLRDGLPQPVPDPGRRQRRRLRHRLLARLQRAGALPRAGRHGPRRDRPQAGQLRLAAVLRPEPSVLPLELQHARRRWTRRRRRTSARNPDRGPQNRLALEHWRGVDPAVEPGRSNVPPVTQPDIWYSYRDNDAARRSARRAWHYGYRTTAVRAATPCPQLFPELYTTGVAPHGAAPYHYDADNPSTTKFPPYYDGAFILGEFNADTLREVRSTRSNKIFKINRFLDCGAALLDDSPFPFECDNPMDMQFGTDGSFYLLTYGDGFFQSNPDAGMYRWEYVKGQRAPQAVLNADADQRHRAADVQFSSDGSRDPDPGDSIRFAWDFDGNGTVDSTDPNPTHVYTTNGVYTRQADGHRLGRQDGHQDAVDHRRQHGADDHDQHAARRRLLRLGRQDPVHGHRVRPRGRPDRLLDGHRDVRARARHARPRRGGQDGLHGRCRRPPRTRRTAATSPAASAPPTPTRAARAACRR